METRVRWLSVRTEPDVVVRDLANAMLRKSFTLKKKSGFQLSEVRQKSLAGSFIDVAEWQDMVELPGRVPLSVHRVEVRETKFLWDFAGRWMEFSDPPRGMMQFRNELLACSYGVSFHPMIDSLSEWVQAFERIAGKVRVAEIATNPLTMSVTATCSFTLKGSTDVRRLLGGLPGGKHSEWTRVVFAFGQGVSCELGKGARARIIGGNDEIRAALRESLVSIQE